MQVKYTFDMPVFYNKTERINPAKPEAPKKWYPICRLNKIKMCQLNIGKQITSVKYPKLNRLQKQILELLNVKLNI